MASFGQALVVRLDPSGQLSRDGTKAALFPLALHADRYGLA